MKVGIIGNGWVARGMQELFPDALTYVRDVNKYSALEFIPPVDIEVKTFPSTTLTSNKEKINKCDVVFICVPTPCVDEGRLDTSIVQECISWCNAKLIVIRSTVNPGDTHRWKMMFKKRIVFQPEYLGETPAHPLLSTKATPFIIIGGSQPDRRKLIELYTTVYNANVKIRQTDDYTAEVIKLTENRAIAFKVAQCQELYDACEKSGTDYYTVRDAVFGDDPRMDLWWSMIYPEKRGFNSKCIPKDVYAWCAWAENNKYKPDVTRAILKRNKKWIGGKSGQKSA